MTDLQLRVLLLNIVARFKVEVEKVDEELGEGVPRNTIKRYTGKSSFPVASGKKGDLKDYETIETTAVSLDGVRELLEDIEVQALSLVPPVIVDLDKTNRN